MICPFLRRKWLKNVKYRVNVGGAMSNISKQAKLSLYVVVLFSLFILHPWFSVQAAQRDTLKVGEQLYTNEQLTSSNGGFRLIMQGDGNLVLYQKNGTPRWASGTQGSGAIRVFMQGDGNLVMYRPGSVAVRSTCTQGSKAVRLVMQNDGNLVLYRANGAAVWASNDKPVRGCL